MCNKRIEASASEKVVVYTVDKPYSKGKPGYVSSMTSHDGDVEFTEDLWRAWAQPRDDWKVWLPSLAARVKARKMELNTHLAVAALVTPK